MFQLSQSAFHARFWKYCAGLLKDLIGTIQLAQVPLDAFVDLTQLLAQLATGVILGLGVDRLEPAAINRDHVPIKQIHVATQSHKLLAHLADRRAVILAEVGNRLEVRLQPTRQPNQLQVTTAFTFQPT